MVYGRAVKSDRTFESNLVFFDTAYDKSLDAELELLNLWKESRGLLISSSRHSEVTESLDIITST